MTRKPDSKLTIRMPADLHADLVQAAEKSSRSLNAEMVHRLLMAPQLADKLDILRKDVQAVAADARQARDAMKRTGSNYYTLERVVDALEEALAVTREDDIATAEEIRGVSRMLETLLRRVDEIERRTKGSE